ncbi:hypothetical protein [Pseudonocardia sp.]|uniref:hypothetical protein n=1 Tax=Pseudonocardia sp. TaxID=60912 RepID=UPI002622DC80|nr:hypothetical protein [Pseudonocardia sp.]
MRRLAAALGLAALALVAIAGPAAADADHPPVGVVVHHDDGTQSRAIRISQLYPTAERQVVLFLDGESTADARRMQLSVSGLADRENGCGRPETRAGDTSCGDGADQGELSGLVELAVTAGRVDGDGCATTGTSAESTLRGLSTDPVVVGLPDAGGVLCVVVDLRHAERPGDDVTQSDSARFDLRMDLDAMPVAAAAPGATSTVTIRPASVVDGAVVDLGPAADGMPLGVPLVIAGVLLGCGATLLAVRHRAAGATP